MLLVKAFILHQRQLVSIGLINVNLTSERRFAELSFDGVMQLLTLTHENSDFPSKMGKSY